MALIDCPECGKKISDKAESCLNCGVPIRRKKDPGNKKNPALIVAAVIGAIVAVIVLISAGSDLFHAFGL